MARLDNPVAQYLDASGDPVPGGKLFFFESGTSTEKDTFVDVNLTTANANPVILDGAGRIPNIFLTGTYKVILKDANSVQIWERDPVGGEAVSTQFGDWDSLTIYGNTDIVRGSDGEYYESIVTNNQNNNPTTAAAAWTQIEFLKIWNTNESYDIPDTVRGSDGSLYQSLTDGNSGNDPISTPAEWGAAIAQATETQAGKAEIATSAETSTGTDDTKIITPQKLAAEIPAASETVAGRAEIATSAEVQSGTDNTRIVTPAGLASVSPLITTVINIGDWNMDATASAIVAHSLDITKIQSLFVMIRNDADTRRHDLGYSNPANDGGYWQIEPAQFSLSRIAGGVFDNTSFDSTSYNRGFIVAQSTP